MKVRFENIILTILCTVLACAVAYKLGLYL